MWVCGCAVVCAVRLDYLHARVQRTHSLKFLDLCEYMYVYVFAGLIFVVLYIVERKQKSEKERDTRKKREKAKMWVCV